MITLKHKKQDLAFTVANFNLNGVSIAAEDAAMDAATIDQILAIEGQGILVPVAELPSESADPVAPEAEEGEAANPNS